MTAYDGVMIGLVVAGMIWGWIRGFAWQIASIGSLVVGYFCAHHVSAYILPFLAQNQPGDPAIQRGGSMLLAYVVISGGIFFAAWSVRSTLRKMKFEVFDRHLGMLLGGIEGALLAVIGTMFVVSMSPTAREPIFSSHAGHVVARVMVATGPVLPAEIRKVTSPFWGGVKATDSPQPFLVGDSVKADLERLGENDEDRYLKRR
jgi:uncharacterized membrane protein required for colicin V production